MQSMIDFMQKDAFTRHVGAELLEASEGRAKAKLDIKDFHLNGLGTVHGAVMFALADLVFEIASNSHGTIAMAINASISYFKAVSEGTLFAEASEISCNPKLASYTIHVTDQHNDMIAIFQGMVYRKKDRIDT